MLSGAFISRVLRSVTNLVPPTLSRSHFGASEEEVGEEDGDHSEEPSGSWEEK